jgi:formylglycine-generating enzyme required for sulfatase activity
MSGVESGEYELVETPEPERPKVPPPAGQPLPRLWKEEPDEPDEKPGLTGEKNKEAKSADGKKATRSDDENRRVRKSKSKPSKAPEDPEGNERKALVEETPALDTYEARQRARLLVGGLVGSCILIFGWIVYRVFLYDPSAMDSPSDDASLSYATPAPKNDLETEAKSMFNRAQEKAKEKNYQEAIRLLESITKAYKGTQTATEAKEALARPKQNLPLFLDRPVVKAEPPLEAPTEPKATPPEVVAAPPAPPAGNAQLILPANPPEQATTQPPAVAMAPTPDVGPKSPAPMRTLPEGFSAASGAGIHDSGWPLTIVGKRDGAPMVLIPGGSFTLGNDYGPTSEAPAHKVRLSAYYIDQHEVTEGQFRLFLKETNYTGKPPRKWSENPRENISESMPMPMVMVNARDAQAYAEWASKQLPTEAQWEAAARSTDGRLFPWGPEPITQEKPRPAHQAFPVKSYQQDVSPYGAYDMAGNVPEWTRDWYDSKYYHQLGGGPVDNPTGPNSKPRSALLVVKGGAKNGNASYREGIAPDKRLTYVGFRCVLPVEAPGGGVNPVSSAPTLPVAPPTVQPAGNRPRGGADPPVPF